MDMEYFELGADAGRGNLLSIQPWMERADYATDEAFYRRLAGYFEQAARKGWLSPRTVAVLPEHLGTWLVTAGERPSVYTATTTTAAMTPIILRRLLPFLRRLLAAREPDRVTAALFRLKAQTMARIYQSTFSRLAREWGVTIAAGSIMLPDPRVVDGVIHPGEGPLYNCAFVFRPDGCAESGISRKFAPIDSELPFTTPAPLGSLPVFDTPAGRLGVLVCADSWRPEAYARLKEQGAELLAVPSAASHGEELWEQPWLGYNGRAAPPDVDPSDPGRLTERQAWARYALGGRMASSGARVAVNVFLYGSLWDLAFGGGRWRAIRGEENVEGGNRPAIVNVWGLPTDF